MKLPAWARWLGAGLMAWLLWAASVGRARAEGALREQIRARELTIAALATQKARVDSVYVRDTVRLARWRVEYRASHDTLRVTDTMAVKVFVAMTDSTIRACSVAVETCERRVAVRDSLLAQQDSLVSALRKRPPLLSRLARPVLPFLVGVGVGMILTK